MSYSLSQVSVRYGPRYALRDISIEFRAGELTAIVGPNGAGKSTLLSIVAGLRRDHTGECRYKGRDVQKWPRREFAREISFVPQNLNLEFPFTAEQVVMMGRAPHLGRMFEGPTDHAAVDRAMQLTDTVPFANRDFRSLSGGERQRVILAAALAQAPKFLLLDEPATFLDLRHQIGAYRLVRDLCREGLGAMAVTHDLNIALTYAARVVLLQDGSVVADGPPAAVLTPDAIERTFGIRADIQASPRPWISYEA